MSKKSWLLLFFLAISVAANAQTIGYDQLLTLLEKKQYQSAEPALRKYLKDNQYKNSSALLYMGNILYEKALEELLSDDDAQTIVLLDSSAILYNLALANLTETTFKGNERYYKEFLTKLRGRNLVESIESDYEKRVDKINRKLKRIKKDEADSTDIEKALRKNGEYYALVIGVSTYANDKLNLDRPIKDAERIKDILVKNYTFENQNVMLLRNPTRQQILKELFSLRKKVGKKDNLLIFFAGHGYWDEDANQGYWWPKDASPDDPTFWLSNSDLKEQIRGVKTKHTLLISDACFSGGIFKTRNADIKNAPLDIAMLYRQPSRRALTSGTLTTVPDQSVFFDYLVNHLVKNQNKYTTSQALFNAIRQAVINNSMIVPQDGVIIDTGDEGGDFIFIRNN